MSRVQFQHTLDALSRALHALGAQGLVADSRQARQGQVFVAWPGYGVDARQFVRQALDAGAPACVVEADGLEVFGFDDARIFSVQNLKMQAGLLAATFYAQPSSGLKVCAFTGTNGKTSCTWFLAQAIEALAARQAAGHCGIIGTLGVGCLPKVVATGLTTPDPMLLQGQLAGFVQDGCSVCAMEASSIGLVEGRMQGVQVHTAVFTNFTQDHLDYHGDMQAYWQAKRALFKWPSLSAAVINRDDAKANELLAECEQSGVRTYTYSVREPADVWASDIALTREGCRFVVHKGGEQYALHLSLYGRYNISNVLAVMATLLSLGFEMEQVVTACADLRPPPGRMQLVAAPAAPVAVVDYAHTPDALAQSLRAVREGLQAQGGKLWCVFGCGGNRDASKRPLMGEAAEREADFVVLTNDNPRDENPQAILQAIRQGMQAPPVHEDPDRAAAIAWALQRANPQDAVLIAGKGHEDYQEVMGMKHAFSDVEQASLALARRGQVSAETELRLGQVYQWLQDAGLAKTMVGDASLVLQRLHTDTRSIRAGDLFLALKGETFDANDMLPTAAAAGASAVVTQASLANHDGLWGIEVSDTKLALGVIAARWRLQFDLPLIAVTGSNGKTTVTQMIAQVLRVFAGEAAFATQGNLNNEIGVPLTLLRLNASHRIGVIELGMNHPGEIDYLAALVRPKIAVINNAQREHQEFMQSVDAVALENGAVLTHLSADGVAVFPADEAYVGLWKELNGQKRSLLFALHGSSADVSAQADWQEGAWWVQARSPQGAFSYRLQIAGRHHVKNSLAAAAACLAAGVPIAAIAQGLSDFVAVPGRCRALKLALQGQSIDVIDDSYNANPDSVCAAIDVLAELPGPHLLVLGDMGEVGDQGDEFHAEVGEYAAERGIETLYGLGELMRYAATAFPGARHFASMDSLQAACVRDAGRYRSILIKGSRFMKMERVLVALEAAASKERADAA